MPAFQLKRARGHTLSTDVTASSAVGGSSSLSFFPDAMSSSATARKSKSSGTMLYRPVSRGDPLNNALLPPADETNAARERRMEQESTAKMRSDEIDKWLKGEAAARRKAIVKRGREQVQLALLGQSQSGKTTLLKQVSIHLQFTLC